MVNEFQAHTTENPSQIDSIMGGIVRASIDEYIKEVNEFQEREIFPGVSFMDIAQTDPKYREATARTKELEEALKGLLSPEGRKLLDDYGDAFSTEMSFEVKYFYKHGFIDGVAHSQIPARWAQDIGRTLPLQGGAR